MSLLDDVRSLGVGAPLRAGYEVSKRAGGHALVFGRLARRTVPQQRMRLLDVPPDVPASVAELTVAHAHRIAAGSVEVFGTQVPVGAVPDWHALVEREGGWPRIPWWQIDIRSDARAADVKWTWELGRFRHVVILARACRVAPDDGLLADALRRHVTSFLDDNPFEIGVHWYSNLELALRAFAFAQIVALAEPVLGPDLVERVTALLWHTGRHLLADLPYTISTMRNNHLLGDGVGMVVVGRAFGSTAFGRRLVATGDRLVRRFLTHAAKADGSLIEDSVSYHRFVVELLTVRVLAGGAGHDVRAQLQRAAGFLARLGVLCGPVPQYGDWDEGRALVTAGDPCALVGSVRAALAACGSGAPAGWREAHDDVAWYVPEGDPAPVEDAVSDGSSVGGGVARLALGDVVVFLKTAAGGSHNHADASSVTVRVGDTWLVGDPGTGTYNGDIEQRTWFRSSTAHSVLRVNGEDQLGPLRAFRWKHTANGRIGRPVHADGVTVMWCWHDAYARLEQPVRVVRTVTVGPGGVAVADWFDRDVSAEGSLPLGPEVGWSDSAGLLDGPEGWALDVPSGGTAATGATAPFDGWWSTTYGKTAPSTRLAWTVSGPGPHLWSLVAGTAGAPSGPVAAGGGVVADGATVRVAFAPGVVRLAVASAGRAVSMEETTP